MKLKVTDDSALRDKDLATEDGSAADEVLNLLYTAVAELNLQRSDEERLEPSLDTALFGDGGNLDSLALANFIIITEQKFEERFGFKVDLTQDDPFSPATGHFKTVGSLARYILALVNP